MKRKSYEQIPIIGRLQRVVLTDSSFELNDPFEPLKKGVVTVEASMEVGIKETTLDGYFVSIAVTVRGRTTEGAEKQAFIASCKMFGYYNAENASKLGEDLITRAARARGALQIYPLVRNHLMYLSRVSGIRFSIPLEPDFHGAIESAPKSKKKVKNTRRRK